MISEQAHNPGIPGVLLKRRRKVFQTVLVGFSIGFAVVVANPPSLNAQSKCPECLLDDPLVDTPTGRPGPLMRAPTTTTIITAEEIRRSPATTVPDLLRSVPGLDVFAVSVSDANVTARGLNTRIAHRMQVYIDGRSVYEDFFNLVPWHQLPISLQEIERIEIVKSPASALYGFNAFSGVIHIITKSPEALKGTQLSEIAGNAGTNIATVLHGGTWDKLSYKFMYEYDRTNQFPNKLIGPSRDREMGREDFRGNVFAEYAINERSRASFAAGVDRFDRDLDPGLISTAAPSRVHAIGAQGFVKLNYALADFKAQFVWDRLDMDLRSPFLPQVVRVLGNTAKLDVQHSVDLGTTNVLTMGGSYRNTSFSSRYLVGHGRYQNAFGFFLQDEYSPLPNLTLTSGARVDTHPEAGVRVAPRGSVVYSPWENHTFRASVSRAYRSPSVLENFVNFDITTPEGAAHIRGNQNARAEGITSFEIGYLTRLFDRFRARVDLFYNLLDNLSTGPVPTGPLPPGSPLQVGILNGGRGNIYGGEIGMDFFFAKGLIGYMNYSYQERQVADPRVLGMGPNHKGNVGLNITLPQGWEADFWLNAVGPSSGSPGKVGSYNTVNLHLAYPFEWAGTKFRLTFGATNLFNDKHQEIPGGDFIDRRIVGGLQFRF